MVAAASSIARRQTAHKENNPLKTTIEITIAAISAAIITAKVILFFFIFSLPAFYMII